MIAVAAIPHEIQVDSLVFGFALVLVVAVLALSGLLAINLMRRLLGSAGD